MGFIYRPQRRALERAIGADSSPIFILKPEQTFYFNGQQIFLAGIEEGKGTCSERHKIVIAAFTEQPVTEREILVRPRQCHGAVLGRKRKEGEFDPEFSKDLLPRCVAVEGLAIKIIDKYSKQIFFKSNGKVKLYIPLI